MKKSRSPRLPKHRVTFVAGTSLLLATASVHAVNPYQYYDIPGGEIVTISHDLTDADGISLQKSGAGTLILTGSNSYSGNTEVIDGALSLSGSGARIVHESGSLLLGMAAFMSRTGLRQRSLRPFWATPKVSTVP